MHAYAFCVQHIIWTIYVIVHKNHSKKTSTCTCFFNYLYVMYFVFVWFLLFSKLKLFLQLKTAQFDLLFFLVIICQCVLWLGKTFFFSSSMFWKCQFFFFSFRRSRLYQNHHQPPLILLKWHSQPTPSLPPLLLLLPPPALWPSPLPQSQVSQPPSPPWVLPVSWCTLMRIFRWWVLEFCSNYFFDSK